MSPESEVYLRMEALRLANADLGQDPERVITKARLFYQFLAGDKERSEGEALE